MFYQCGNPILEILTVGRFCWQQRQLYVPARPYCALAFRLEGGGSLVCNGTTYTLSPGDVLYMPQGVSYHHDYTDTDLLLFHFVTVRNDPCPEIYHLDNPDAICRQFQKAVAVWQEKKPGYMGVCMSILYRILGLLGELDAYDRMPAHFIEAVTILSGEFRNSDLRIGDVCARAAISQTVFRELFRIHYARTPVAYLTELRLEHARSLIAEGASVEQAALRSGFSDPKYFARVVRRIYGCTPKQL